MHTITVGVTALLCLPGLSRCAAPATRPATVDPSEGEGFFFAPNGPDWAPCWLVAPFENYSDANGVGELASDLLAAEINETTGYHALGHGEAEQLLARLGLADARLTETSTAFSVAKLVGANGVFFGTVAGSWQSGPGAPVLLESRLVGVNPPTVMWTSSRVTQAAPGQSAPQTMSTALRAGLRPMLEHLRRALPTKRAGNRTACFGLGELQKHLGELERISERTARRLAASAKEPEPVAIPASEAASEAPPLPSDSPPGSAEIGAEARALLERLRSGESVPVPGVRFPKRSATIAPLRDPILDLFAELLASQPELRLAVHVHIDATRDEQADAMLTQVQAAALARRLASKWAIAETRLKPVGRGATHPIQPNVTLRGRMANRRVEIAATP